MRIFYILVVFLGLSASVRAADTGGSNCELAQKELDLVKAQLAMIVEKYKISVKNMVKAQLKVNPGQKVSINVDPNNELVKALTKLSIAEATFEATVEMCKDGSLKKDAANAMPPAPGQEDYKALLIPKP